MFRSSIFKSSVVLFLGLILSACAGITPLAKSEPVAVLYPVPLIEPLPFEADLPPVELEFEVAVVEKAIPLTPLNERAIVRMTDAEVKCMANAIYFEAKSESEIGQIAVGYVVLNRMADSRFPNSACSVVYQKTRGRCEFSWYCAGLTVRNQAQYRKAEEIARVVMLREVDNPIDNSLFFHATYVKRNWRYAQEIRIGGHRFHRNYRPIAKV